MTELLEAVTSPWNLLWVLVVFGLAPGLCLRLIVLAYPRSNPRRAELVAELYAVPRMERPLWVAEQLEVALFEGLGSRISAVARRLVGRTQEETARIGWLLSLVNMAMVVAAESLGRLNIWVAGFLMAAFLVLGMRYALMGHVIRARQAERSDSEE